MPRDFTERRSGQHDVKSHYICGIPYKMQKQKNKEKQINMSRPKKPTNGRMSEAKPLRFRGQRNDYAREASKLTPDGLDWLIAAIDPFHDFQRQIAGYPDVDGSNSVVSCSTSQFDIAAPGAVAWDCNIFTLPITEDVPMSKYSQASRLQGTIQQTPAVTALTLASVTAVSVTAGEKTFPDDLAWAPAGYAQKFLNADNLDHGAVSRLVGWGIEIINTSPELNKSGALLAYRVPQRRSTSSMKFVDPTAGNLVNGSLLLHSYCRPPCTAAEASILPHTQAWEAKDGAYIPVSLATVENPATFYEYASANFQEMNNIFVGAEVSYGTSIVGAAVTTDPICPVQRFLPYDTVGVYLTNLDPKSTFTVRTKMYWEKFPGTSDAVLLPLATPSPKYDLKALQLYASLLHDLPIGTKSDNNANGDWFKMILKYVRQIGLPIVSLLPGGNRMGRGILDTADNLVGGFGRAFPFLP